MRYIKDTDYEALWNALECKINILADDHDWKGAISDDAEEQRDHYSKKEMCNQILEIMDSILRNSNPT